MGSNEGKDKIRGREETGK